MPSALGDRAVNTPQDDSPRPARPRIDDRIVEFETIRLGGHPNLLFVRVRTASGVVGAGDTFYAAGAVESYIHDNLAPELLGADPSAVEKHWNRHVTNGFARWGGFGAELRALSAIDIALWDIHGQELGVPLHRLLGGLTRDRIRTYNTCAGPGYGRGLQPSGADIDPLDDLWAQRNAPADLAQSLLAEGISAMKIWPFDEIAKMRGGRTISAAELEQALQPIIAIREAVGLDMDIMLEGHGLWDVATAVKIAAALEPYKLTWLEDLVNGADIDAVAELSASTNTPVIASEMIVTRQQYRQLLQRNAADSIMIDPSWVGGITETRKLTILAESFGRSVSMHDCTGPFTLMAGVHVALSAPNAIFQESVRAYLRTWYAELTDGTIDVVDGHILAPDTPGIGLALASDVLERPDCIRRVTGV